LLIILRPPDMKDEVFVRVPGLSYELFKANERISGDAPRAFYCRPNSHASIPFSIATGRAAHFSWIPSFSRNVACAQTTPSIDGSLDRRTHLDHDMVSYRFGGLAVSKSAHQGPDG
jgi:hypothetical protein